ncbi:tetratricopeptide repeat protein [Herminiimonas sp. CN]|uniref:L,D-transpeptidase Cds6 family protein n=1 Tax=Herminiimonas sp. CN TaxID=1349818 RepID=UPI0004732B12|nr:tetratricopeptide repeat protein [Herminiimonas sp. CN]
MPFATRHSLNLSINRVFGRIIALSGLLAAFYAMPVLADDLSEVGKLTQSGQYGEALAKANAYLARQPRDAQMRFLKGLILTEQNKSTEAIAVFTKLTEDFPRLPEPYNNLAVLFAATNQYEKSRIALEMAIRTNPTYATAHENLGDVYAKLASQAYDKALQLDTNNAAAKSKLTLIRTLMGSTAAGVAHKNGTAPALTAKPAVLAATATEKPASVSPETKTEARPNAAKNTPVAAANPLPAKAEHTAAVKHAANTEPHPAPKENTEIGDIINAVNKWASAWSDQDMKGYLGAYSSDFQPPQGLSHKAWSEERRARIEGKNRINIKIASPKVVITGDSATVKFRQSYKSNNFTSNSSKTLLMTKQGGKWQIKQERTGS